MNLTPLKYQILIWLVLGGYFYFKSALSNKKAKKPSKVQIIWLVVSIVITSICLWDISGYTAILSEDTTTKLDNFTYNILVTFYLAYSVAVFLAIRLIILAFLKYQIVSEVQKLAVFYFLIRLCSYVVVSHYTSFQAAAQTRFAVELILTLAIVIFTINSKRES